jgi:DNA uptake protein ComE-like DNA-binding protein
VCGTWALTAAGAGAVDKDRAQVNTALAFQLQQVDGVGRTTAAAIVAERSARGPFTDAADLHRRLRDHHKVVVREQTAMSFVYAAE